MCAVVCLRPSVPEEGEVAHKFDLIEVRGASVVLCERLKDDVLPLRSCLHLYYFILCAASVLSRDSRRRLNRFQTMDLSSMKSHMAGTSEASQASDEGPESSPSALAPSPLSVRSYCVAHIYQAITKKKVYLFTCRLPTTDSTNRPDPHSTGPISHCAGTTTASRDFSFC